MHNASDTRVAGQAEQQHAVWLAVWTVITTQIVRTTQTTAYQTRVRCNLQIWPALCRARLQLCRWNHQWPAPRIPSQRLFLSARPSTTKIPCRCRLQGLHMPPWQFLRTYTLWRYTPSIPSRSNRLHLVGFPTVQSRSPWRWTSPVAPSTTERSDRQPGNRRHWSTLRPYRRPLWQRPRWLISRSFRAHTHNAQFHRRSQLTQTHRRLRSWKSSLQTSRWGGSSWATHRRTSDRRWLKSMARISARQRFVGLKTCSWVTRMLKSSSLFWRNGWKRLKNKVYNIVKRNSHQKGGGSAGHQ